MQTDTYAFIIRIWHEAIDPKEKIVWRGSIERVGTEQRLYFFDLDCMLQFIQDQAGLPRPGSNSLWRAFLDWVR